MRSALRMALWVCALLSLGACTDRAAAIVDGTRLADGDHLAADLTPRADDAGIPSTDAILFPDASAFCSGTQHLVAVDGELISVLGIETGTTLTSCCDGEQIRIRAADSSGAAVQMTVNMLRYLHTTPDPVMTIDLGTPPSGWLFSVACQPYEACGNLDAQSATFSGTLVRTSLMGAPAVEVSLCLAATPKPNTRTLARPVELWIPKVTIYTACIYGMDPTCNYDLASSSLHGSCNEDGTCTCNPGAQLMANGKCQ